MNDSLLKIVIFAAILAILIGAGGFAFAHWARRVSLFFPDRYPSGQWDWKGRVQPRDVTFESARGIRLHAWHFPAADPNAPLLVWFHGNAGNLTYRADTAEELAMRGISVFIFDYRGYGKSEGSPTESGLYDDSLAAYDFAAKNIAEAKNGIVLYGESLGGPYAAFVATKRPAKCVVVENSFASLSEVADLLYAKPLGVFAPGALRTADNLNKAGLPVLVTHSKRDSVLPYQLGASLFRQLRVEKEMYTSETADHSMMPVEDGPRFFDAVTGFIFRHVRGGA